MNGMQWILALLALSLSGDALAAAIGLPENTARIGYAAGVARLAVDDPAGPSKAAVEALPLTLIYSDWLAGGLRYWAEGYYARATLDAGVSEVGQEVSRAGARLALQRNLHWGPWSPWLGLGLDLASQRYTKRHTVDSDGYLVNTYADRSATALGINVHLIHEWALARDWDLSAKLEQVIPVSGGMFETSLSVGALYRY